MVRGARFAEPAYAAGTLAEDEDVYRVEAWEMRQAALDSSGDDAARAGDLLQRLLAQLLLVLLVMVEHRGSAAHLHDKEATSATGAEILLSTRRPLPATRQHAFLSLASRINCSARNASLVPSVPHPWATANLATRDIPGDLTCDEKVSFHCRRG